MNFWICASDILSSSASVDEPVGQSLVADPLDVEAAAVVGDADDDVAAFVIGGEANDALLRLAGGDPLGARLQAVVGGVAHHVGERILDALQHLAVELGVGAVHSSSMSLPSSAERSRTMRGSFCQALPIGCMRVRMTPSCSSAVTLDSRCSGTLNSDSSWRRTMSRSWLRVSTSSDTMVIRLSSVSTLTRIDLLATVASASSFVGPLVFSDLSCSVLRCLGLDLRRCRRSEQARRVAEHPLQFVERNLAGSEAAVPSVCGTNVPTVCVASAAAARPTHAHLAHHIAELIDQIGVGAFRLALMGFKLGEDLLDPVDGEQHQRHGLTGDRRAVAEFAHQAFRGMGQRLETRQAEKTAGAFDGMDEAEHVAENLGVVGLLLETNQLDVDHVEALVGFDQEFLEQVVHRQQPSLGERWPPDQFHPSTRSVASRRLISVAERERLPNAVNDARLTRRGKTSANRKSPATSR